MTDPRPPLRVVDPHIHVWDVGTGLYPRRSATPDPRGRSGDYLLADLLADTGAVELVKAVHIEAFPTDGLAEARHVQRIADAAPNGMPQGIVANTDLADPDAAAHLEALAALANVRGIRQALYLMREARALDLMEDTGWQAGFGRLAAHGLSFDLQLSPPQAPAAAALAARFPQTVIIVGHTGTPLDRTLAGWRAWREELRTLAAAPNVSIKISGLAMFDPGWTVESLRPYVFETLEAFGPDRAMFASNFPVDKAASDYQTLWEAFAAIVATLTESEQAGLMRSNAERFYRI